MSNTTITQRNLWQWIRQLAEKITSQRRAHHPQMEDPNARKPEKFNSSEIVKESIFIGHR